MYVITPRVHRVDLSDAVENVDMSLEELQHLLLRSHQQNTVESGSSTVMDVSRYVPLTRTHSIVLKGLGLVLCGRWRNV